MAVAAVAVEEEEVNWEEPQEGPPEVWQGEQVLRLVVEQGVQGEQDVLQWERVVLERVQMRQGVQGGGRRWCYRWWGSGGRWQCSRGRGRRRDRGI